MRLLGSTGRWALVLALLWGCSESSHQRPVIGDNAFESADPAAWDEGNRYSNDDANAGADADADGESSPEREIEEADIVKLEGDTLYALSAYRGLVIIDVSDPDDLAVLGRHPTTGWPFEMYVRDGVAYAMYSSFWSYVYDEVTGTSDWVSTSRVMALDVHDPEAIEVLGVYDLAGEVSDSRIVGDVLYAVAYENGWCWSCDPRPRTTITSINIADPTNIAVIDRLAYEDDDSGWRRSITVTQERMYVSGFDWGGESSTIQVVDISDPRGELRAGAELEIAGQIQSRWQMDEHDGVLRVVSQPGWWSGDPPVVETFRVDSAADITRLGRLEMTLPRPESLQSVRFDGTRGYAVTFQQTDPLFILDLSDPDNPVQRGELEIPGWLYYMEPRGDRMYAIGFDDSVAGSSLAVSLFDVSDLDAPRMLDRVLFGTDWGWMVEDQDRIHKAFRLLDEQQMIVMPFGGWDCDDEYYWCDFRSGIQLVDFTADDLQLRGVVPHRGFARRAFVHRDRLFAMSDERVEAFDVADRDHPAIRSSLVLARNVFRIAPVGDHVAELVSDWWSGEARLDLLPLDSPDGITATGSLDLSSLRPEDSSDYYYWSYSFGYGDSRLFADGDLVYLVWGERNYCWYGDADCTEGAWTGVAVIDVADPAAPRLVGHERFDFQFPYQAGWWWQGTVEAGETIAQVGSTLVFRNVPFYYWWYEDGTEPAPALEVVDLSDPAAPAHAATFSLGDGQGLGTLQVEGGDVLTSHREPVAGEPGRARFYMDRIDVSDPAAPRLVESINIPGSPIWLDAEMGRLVTVDYQTSTRPAATWEECYGDEYGYYYYDSDTTWDEAGGVCITLRRSLNLLDLRGVTATLIDRLEFGERKLRDVRVTPERVFVGTQPRYSWWWGEDGTEHVIDPRPELITLTGVESGAFVERSSSRMSSPYTWLYAAYGTRAVVLSDTPPSLDVYDAADATDPVLVNRTLLTGWGYDVRLLGDVALSANSMWGVQVIPLE